MHRWEICCLKTREAGGLALGATATSLVFGAVVVALVGYLTMTGADVIETPGDDQMGAPLARTDAPANSVG